MDPKTITKFLADIEKLHGQTNFNYVEKRRLRQSYVEEVESLSPFVVLRTIFMDLV